MIRGVLPLSGGGLNGRTLLWRSSLRPLILVRSLFAKAWETGISTKEYLILFEVITLNFRTWDEDSRQSALFLMFLFKENRKKLKDWDSSSGTLESALSRFVHKVGRPSIKKELLADFRILRFLHRTPNEKEFEMRVVKSSDSKKSPTKRVRTPSSVGTKRMNNTKNPPIIGSEVPGLTPKGLDEEIILMYAKLEYLGVPSSALSESSSGNKSADESWGQDETPFTPTPKKKKLIEEFLLWQKERTS